MLLSDADRERLFEVLKAHAAAGRLSVAELERRVAVVAGAETTEEAAAALEGLPAVAGPSLGAAGAGGPGGPRRGRGHGERDAPSADWQPTAERFRDPRSGRIMRVWVDGSGGRHYVPDGG